jgi:hypothetical protein
MAAVTAASKHAPSGHYQRQRCPSHGQCRTQNERSARAPLAQDALCQLQ